jgi:succinate dehydrogenase / fumarate reductase flavoprotein subunit
MFIGAGLTACSNDSTSQSSGGTNTQANGKETLISYSVYDTDILIIGTGFGGIGAALEANAKGAKVLMVDKGPFEFSGAAGMNWDQEVTWPNTAPEGITKCSFNDVLANQKLVSNVHQFLGKDAEAWNAALWWVRMGNTTWNRLSNGNFENLISAGSDEGGVGAEAGGVNLVQRGFSRHIQDTLKTQPITIIDNTMITDIFLDNGKCVGAVGYQVQTGEYRVFRSKATIATAGACCQMYGWLDVHPIGMNTPDNTGDVDAAAYRHGVPLVSNEFFGVDLISVHPSSLGASFNAGIGADGNHMQFVCDKDGEFFMRETNAYDVSRPIRDRILAGKGGEHGGVFIDLTSPEALDRTKLRPCYLRNVYMWKEKFNIDVTQSGYRIPVSLECFEHGGAFVIDENCSSSIPGLFGTRGYGLVKGHITQQTFVGAFAGLKAYEYAQDNDVKKVDWTAAEAEISRIDEIRTREVSAGIRPFEIRHKIQNNFYDNWEPATDAAKLQKAIAELERIKKEDLPKQYVADKSATFNRDWKDAIENYNLIDMTEATLRSALMREESRLTFYRTDFPEQDDKNWHVNIYCKLNNGNMELSKSEQVLV